MDQPKMKSGLQIHRVELQGMPREVAIQTDGELTCQKSYYLEGVLNGDNASKVAASAGNPEMSGGMSVEKKKMIEMAQLFSRRYGISSPIPRLGELRVNDCARKQPIGSYCPFDCLPVHILHDILSRLSILDLLRARQSCVSWRRIVSSCQIFQKLYDERNHESWIVLRSRSRLNPNSFVLFNANDAKQYHFSLAQHVADPLTKSWLLQGVADGLMLLASREGRLAVANPLTRRLRLLPDARLGSGLLLKSCLKKRLWQQPEWKKIPWLLPHLPSISINIFGDSASKSFKVMVWGELTDEQVHALVYNSRTDTWSIQLCPEIDHNVFRRLSHSTTDGTTIYCNSYYRNSAHPGRMVSYNTETLVSVAEEMWEMDLMGINPTRVQTIGMVAYNSRIYLLGVFDGRLLPLTFVVLWEANPNAEQWRLVTKAPLYWGNKDTVDFDSCEAAAAYGGNQSVSILLRKAWKMRLMKLNLDTKEFKIRNLEQLTCSTLTSTAASQDKVEPFRAFQMQLKFFTAM